MASEFDQSDFVDSDYQASVRAASGSPPSGHAGTNRPPSLEELDLKAGEKMRKLMELRQAQEALERERSTLLEARRRRNEFQTGRQEMIQHLTRSTGLLEKAELSARRDAEQMAKSLVGLNTVLDKINEINPDGWTAENYEVELTKALTTIENARLEWNSAQLKWPLLTGNASTPSPDATGENSLKGFLGQLGFREACRLSLAFTWPLAITSFLALVLLAVLLLRK